VLTIVSSLARCGPINVLKGIAGSCDRQKYSPVVGTLSQESADSCLEEFRALDVPVRSLGLPRIRSLFVGACHLRQLVIETGADLVHCHGMRADILASRSELPCPVLSTLHCDLLCDYTLLYGRRLGYLMAMREYKALRALDAVVAVSQPTAAAAGQHGISARVIENGVDVGLYSPPMDSTQRRSLRARFGWGDHEIVILHTGALIRRKKPVALIVAFKSSRVSKRVRLVFAGDGPLWQHCHEAADGAGNIEFIGKRTDIADLLRAADVLISNSESEGLPMALLEGCATGVLVLATDIQPHRHLQTIFPQQVQLFSSWNLESLFAGLERVYAGQRAIAPQFAIELISDRRMSIEYQNLYSELLAARC
jgi:glycosyltransferase involved in cell wall biosynthesis